MKPSIITQTADYLVLNKPANMPCEGPSPKTTLYDWLLTNNLIDPSVERGGIVHRLDTDTSGVIIWAKNSQTQQQLRELWQGRVVKKTYIALVSGACEPHGLIELGIRRNNKLNKQEVAHLSSIKDRPAITEYKLVKTVKVELDTVSLLEVHPVTGRTHQIRVHLQAIGHPIIGDSLYGNKLTDQIAKKVHLTRQFLHASKLQLPDCGEFTADLPEELKKVVKSLNLE